MFQRENSDYLQKEVLSKNFYLQVKSSLEELKKKQNFRIPLRDRIRIRAEELWQEDINKERNDLDNWLLAEKEEIEKTTEDLNDDKLEEEGWYSVDTHYIMIGPVELELE